MCGVGRADPLLQTGVAAPRLRLFTCVWCFGLLTALLCIVPPAGEEVTFSEVVGMTELNGHPPIRVKNCKAHSFYLEVDSTNWR